MKQAYRRFGKQTLIDADSAPRGDYICPVCAHPVFLRNGLKQVPSFAHYQGYGSEACELFNGGQGQVVVAPSPEHAKLAVVPWNIALALEMAATHNSREWGLILSVPTPRIVDGRLHIDVGGRIQKLDLRNNTASSKRITAEPSKEPYRVCEVIPRGGVLDTHLGKECPGLDQEGTAFGPIKSEEKVIPRAREIHAGQDYIILWNEAQQIPIPEEFDAIDLAKNGEWNGALISIPSDPEETEKAWIFRVTGLPLRSRLSALVTLWPPVFERLNFRLVNVLANKCHLFSFDSLKQKNVALFVKSKTSELAATIYDVQSSVLKIQAGDEREFKIVARDDSDVELMVDRTRPLAPWHTTGINLLIQERDDAVNSYSLCDSRTAEVLQQVRMGRAKIIRSLGPKKCTAKFRVLSNGVWKKECEFSCSADEFALKLTSTFSRWSNVDIQLDVGAYGRLTVNGPVTSDGTLELSAELKKNIISYLSQYSRNPRVPLDIRELKTDDLIFEFHNAHPTSRTVAHYSALKARIMNVNKNSK